MACVTHDDDFLSEIVSGLGLCRFDGVVELELFEVVFAVGAY